MLRDFAAYYRPWKGLFWLDFGSAVLSGLLELAFPLAVKLFIDVLLPRGDLALTILAAAGLLVVYVLNTGLMAIVTYWGHMLGINIETEMRRRAFEHLQRLSFSYFDKVRTGKLVARVTRDLEEIGEVAHHGPEDLFVAVMTFAGAFVMMLTIDVRLALITAAIVPLCTAVVFVFGGRMTRTWRAIYARVADFNVRLEENVGGIRVVQAFANEDHEKTALRPRQCPLPRHEARRLPGHGRLHHAQLHGHAPGAGGRHGRRRGLRAARRAHHRRLCRLPAARRRVLPPDGEDRRGDRALSARHRRVPPLSRPAGAPPRHGRPRGRGRGARLHRRHRLRGRHLRLRSRPAGPARRHAPGRRRRDGGLRRPIGGGQDHAPVARPALLRAPGRPRHDRRPRPPRRDPALAAPPDRHRQPGRVPLRRHPAREHRLWPARRHRGRDPRRGRQGATGGDDRRPARGARHGGRRARRHPLGRPEAARRHRPDLPAAIRRS